MDLKERLIAAKAVIAEPKDWGQGPNRDCPCVLDAVRVGEDETDADPEVMLAIDYLFKALPPDFPIRPGRPMHPVAQFGRAHV